MGCAAVERLTSFTSPHEGGRDMLSYCTSDVHQIIDRPQYEVVFVVVVVEYSSIFINIVVAVARPWSAHLSYNKIFAKQLSTRKS